MNYPSGTVNMLLHSQMRKATITIEIIRVKFLIAFLALGLIVMFANFFLVADGASFFKITTTKFAVLGWLAVFLMFEIVTYFVLNYYFKKKIDLPNYLKTFNVIIEALLPGILLFMLVTIEDSPIFLDSPLIFIYFILLSLAALNLRLINTIILGVISTLSYFIVTVWAIYYHDPEGAILHFPPSLYIARSIFMLLAFLGATLVAKEFKKWLNLSLNLQNENIEMERIFGQQVSGPIAQSLLKDDNLIKAAEVTVLFLDIRGYSRFAEQKSPEEIIRFQNNFFNPIITMINTHQGIVNQILGDGLMATFGAPVSQPDHAQKAFDASLAIFEQIKVEISKNKIPETKFGIGLHSGEVVMGNIGNELRKQFSISGHTVNIAARIEQANKEFNAEFLISQSTFEKVKGVAHTALIGDVQMKNMSNPIKVYKVK